MELVDPVRRVRDEKLAHRLRAVAVEVHRVAPFVHIAVGEVLGRVVAQHAAIGSQVVVDDVEDHADADRMRAVHEAPQVIRGAVEPRRRKQEYAIVAPAEGARELGDGHHLDHVDPVRRQPRQLARRSGPRPLARERPDV